MHILVLNAFHLVETLAKQYIGQSTAVAPVAERHAQLLCTTLHYITLDDTTLRYTTYHTYYITLDDTLLHYAIDRRYYTTPHH